MTQSSVVTELKIHEDFTGLAVFLRFCVLILKGDQSGWILKLLD